MIKKILKKIMDYFMVLLAGGLYAAALKYFVLPSRVILTGTEGIASSLSYYFDSYVLFIILYLIFQTILLVFAFLRVSKMFAFRSLLVVLSVVCMLAILPELSFAQPEPQNERIILVIFGGLLSGVAKAISFKHRGSTGDEDIIGAYFAMKYLKPVGAISIIAAVVSTSFGISLDYLKTGAFENAVNTLMYTSIYIFVSAETLNNLYRKFQTTLLTIVTTDHKSVGQVIRKTFDHRTFTVQSGHGGHSGDPFSIVKTIITREELPQLLHEINKVGSGSFYYYQDLNGISQKYYITPIGK
ncbi:YitT family protein [Oceanispirochaeta crateris]|uniref:YitT family protein n=1 Tax=Oceanispirochaeta crateris TaxID=2518645 RepID=A0A5C1QPW5_9SPIO|nr:YitT family protein [Oceanispirochaeta crateris]QEN08616.1 YitT family protein [Oceanispirochaeta crateris]